MNAGHRTVSVWDPVVRFGHWFLAFAVLGSYALGDDGGTWHEALGYAALAAVAVRLAWGFVGPRHARFTDFVRGPVTVMAYLKALIAGRDARFLGHNPAGAVWIVVLLTLVVTTGGTGWALSSLGDTGYHWLENLHEGLANTLIIAVAVHVAGVVWESIRHRENLVASMFTGRKRAAGEDAGE